MTTATMRYELEDFKNIAFDGFEFEIPERTMNLISSLAMEVGSPTYVRTPNFKKNNNSANEFTAKSIPMGQRQYRKNRTKATEVSNEDWESIRTFQTTKIETKEGLDGEINKIRNQLNKITDKTYLDIRETVIGIIDSLVESNTPVSDLEKVGDFIFEKASTDKHYSKLYADLFSDMMTKYTFLRTSFDRNFASYMTLFNNIEYVDPDINYDKFCENNKVNEKRKAISTFLVNLAGNRIITNLMLAEVLRDLLKLVMDNVNRTDAKNIVDELTENVAILYKKELINNVDEEELAEKDDDDYLAVYGDTIDETIVKLAKSKSKDFKSLSNRSIFKYMDLVEM